jgi:hypothetical protein
LATAKANDRRDPKPAGIQCAEEFDPLQRDRLRRPVLKLPRISIAGLMGVVAVLALAWYVALIGVAGAERAQRHNLSLQWSWTADSRDVPQDQPVYAEFAPLLESEQLMMGLILLALGAAPMAGLLGFGAWMMIRGLIGRGECSPFVLGFFASGTATLVGFIGLCFLAPPAVCEFLEMIVMYCALVPMEIAGFASGDQMERAIFHSTFMFVLGLPQVLFAMLGGWLNERYVRLTIKILPRTFTLPPNPNQKSL